MSEQDPGLSPSEQVRRNSDTAATSAVDEIVKAKLQKAGLQPGQDPVRETAIRDQVGASLTEGLTSTYGIAPKLGETPGQILQRGMGTPDELAAKVMDATSGVYDVVDTIPSLPPVPRLADVRIANSSSTPQAAPPPSPGVVGRITGFFRSLGGQSK